jgi:excisionase family DNA binding protein
VSGGNFSCPILTGGPTLATTTEPSEKRRSLENATYDTPDIAALLKCSARHVRRLVDAGDIPGVIRLGRLVRFHRSIVDEWLAKQAKGVR